MAEQYSVSLEKIIEKHDLEIVYIPKPADQIDILTNEVNRPGIQLAGYTGFFDSLRIQILGWTELGFLAEMSSEDRTKALGYWLSLHPAAAVVTRGLEIPDYFVDACKEYEVPLLRTDDETSPFLAALIDFLNRELAPRITRHGVLVEVYGEGVLIVGESGAGKSETAIELIKRGHRLIADDAVEIRKVSESVLEGSSPSNIRHFIELRGIGIINARRVFGMGAVKPQEKIDMVIQLEEWDSTKAYDRLGLDNEYTKILDVKVPVIIVPITPGRNLAVIVETAAMNNRQKKMGYNGAKELMHSLGMDDVEPNDKELEIWNNS
ncbi:MAG: HPr(Ser) kinase/phosphatase [Eubacterium sp.]|nr:HPr(Ser) kinase/phosphatase [Eubacterium sp.]